MTKAYSYIRISSKKQERGEGIRRQLERADAYAKKHGLEIDTQLQDIASGYHAKHVTHGALGAFLDLVKEGRIEAGSVLIVESLDRLSRADVISAQAQLLTLLSAGIDVVTLTDEARYSRDRDFTQLIISLTIMSRANEESSRKADFSLKYHSQRLNDIAAGHKRHIVKLPRWLDQTRIDGSKEYDYSLNRHAETAKEIFRLYNKGLGASVIAQRFNQQSIPVYETKTKWHVNGILRVIRSIVAKGDYQVDDVVLPDFFPAVVSRKEWQIANDRLSKQDRTGRRGKTVTNLFSGLTKCFVCGGNARVVGGGSAYKYLTCETAHKTGIHCDGEVKWGKRALPYDPIEKAILDNVGLFVEVEESPKDASDLAKEVAAHLLELDGINKKINNLLDLAEDIDNVEDRANFRKRLAERRSEKATIEQMLSEKQTLINEVATAKDRKVDLKSYVDDERTKWPDMTVDDLYESRSNVALRIKSIVSAVRIDAGSNEVHVAVGGVTKGWTFSGKGDVVSSFDFSHLPIETIQKMTKGVGLSVSEKDVEKVRGSGA